MGIPNFLRKKLGIPIFVLKMIEYFGNSMSSLPLQSKKCLIFEDFPMKNVVKIFGIPMSSLGGVHLICGIAQCATPFEFHTLPVANVA